MKTRTTKITGILITLVMLATMLGAFTLSASAADPVPVARVGDVEYTDFATALSNWVDGTTLTLLDDVSYDTTIEVLDKTVTLDLNGHTLDMSTVNSAIMIGDYDSPTGVLTIQDSGINGTLKGKINTVVVGGVLYLNSGNLTGRIFVHTVGTANITGGSITGSYIDSEGTLNITGGVFDLGVVGRKMTTISGSPEFKVYLDISGGTATISGTPKLSWLKVFYGATVTLNTQPAEGETWDVYMENPSSGTFAVPGEGIELDASRFHSDRIDFAVVKNADGSLALACHHATSTHTTGTNNGDGTHAYTCTVCQTTQNEAHRFVNGYCDICNAPKPYTVTLLDNFGVEIVSGHVAYHGQDLTVELKNIASLTRPEVFVSFMEINGRRQEHEEYYDSNTNLLTIPGEYINGDVVINARACITVTLQINGGILNSIWEMHLIVNGDMATLSEEFSECGWSIHFPQMFSKTGYLCAGIKDTGTGTVYTKYITLMSDLSLEVLWEECTHESGTYTDNGGGTHHLVCTPCGTNTDLPHNATYTNNGVDHHAICEDCFLNKDEAHRFENGFCTGCQVIGGFCGVEGDGTNLWWTLIDGTMTVYGTGAMENYDSGASYWGANYFNDIQKVVIMDGVTSIGNYGFYGCTALTEITIPASVKTIGMSAFGLCTSLTEITIPESVSSIGNDAFYTCTALTTVYVSCSWNENPLYHFDTEATTVVMERHNGTYEMFSYNAGVITCDQCNGRLDVTVNGTSWQFYGLKWNSVNYEQIVTINGKVMEGTWKFDASSESERPLEGGSFFKATFTPSNPAYDPFEHYAYFYLRPVYPNLVFTTDKDVYLPGDTVEITAGVGHPLYPEATDLVQPEITEITYVIGNGEPQILVGNSFVIPADAAGKTIAFTVKVAKVDGCYSERISTYTVEVAKDSAIIGSSVTVGSDLAMNYYVTLGNEGLLENGKTLAMLFKLGNKEILVDTYTVVNGQYVFALEHIAPQQMSDRIDAQLLLVDGEESSVLASHLDYSVKKNVQDLLKLYAEDTALVQLLTDLLVYGEAAQKYMGYNTEDLATNGITGMAPTSTALPETSDRVLTKVADGNASFTSVGVWFGTANRIYVKLNTTENVTLVVKVGDTVIGTYTDLAEAILYTGDIAATDFDAIYTFELYEDETLVQTLTYSINSYAHAKQNSTNAAMAELAKALYRYGVSAEAYANK